MPRLRIWLVALLVVLSTVVAAPAPAAPTLTLAPAVGAPTSVTTVTGAGFAPSSLVDLYFDYTQVGFAATSGTGTFSFQLTVPSTAPPGAHTVTGVAHNGSAAAQRTFTVRTNWPQWRGDASGKGHNRLENVLDHHTVRDLDLEAAPAGAASVTSAAVTSGSYYYVVGNDGHLRAYVRTTHALKFDVAAAATQLIPPVVGSSVVVTTGTSQIQARNLYTGALVWQATLPSAVGAPVFSAGVFYVVARGSPTLTNGLYAFAAACGTGGATCTPRWIGPGGGASSTFPETGAAVGGGRVYARLGNDLVAFRVGCGTGGATCAPLGSATGTVTGNSPVFANSYVYSVEGAAVVARRASCLGCTPAWTGTLPSAASRTVTVAGSHLYVVQGSSLFVFASSCGASTCSPLWSTNTGSSSAYAPTVANGIVYVPTTNDVFAYPTSCSTGCRPLWTAGSGGTFSNAPYATVTVSDAKIFSPSESGLLVYSSAPTPQVSTVPVSQLRPDPRFAAAERRAEGRLAG